MITMAFYPTGPLGFLTIKAMIYIVDATPDDLIAAPAAEIEDLFSSLLAADRAGRHFILIARQLCDWVADHVGLSNMDASHLASVRQRFSTTGALATEAMFATKISIGNNPLAFEVENSRFSMGHQVFNAGNYAVVKSALVLEDIQDDADLYHHLLLCALRQTNVPNCSYEVVHGGGARTPLVFDAEIAKRRVALCLVDTDQKAPYDRKSATALQVLRSNRRNVMTDIQYDPFVGLGLTTVGHELENYIPFQLLKDIPQFTSSASNLIIEPLVSQTGSVNVEDCLWQFFDVKEGLDGQAILAKREAGDISVETLNWICQKLGTNIDEIAELRIEGYGQKVVSNFLSCQALISALFRFSRSQYWREMFLEHFEKILWFCAAPKADRT